MNDASVHMDRMYRYQRYIYDATRKPYLLGRDLMLAALAAPPGGSILEIGCGTGRNLVKAARTYPAAECFGLDVSHEMLVTAATSVERAGLTGRVRLAQADATDFVPLALFDRQKFDRIFISYALSMIPAWQQVLARAAGYLEPGGALHVVDFGQLEHWPGWLRRGLRGWLGYFAVHPRADLPEVARTVAAAQHLQCSVRGYYGGYTVHVVLSRQ